jgi:hypothetical protein
MKGLQEENMKNNANMEKQSYVFNFLLLRWGKTAWNSGR